MRNILSTVRQSASAINAVLRTTTPNAIPLGMGALLSDNVDDLRKTLRDPKRLGKASVRSFASGIVLNIFYLEAADVIASKFNERKRRKEREEIISQLPLATQDEQIDLLARLEQLNRKRQKETFKQFVRNVPSRALRRLYRAFLVEVGWWTMVCTSPVWIPAAVAGTVYTWLVVLPVTAGSAIFADKKIDLDKWMKPALWCKKLISWTFGLGWRIASKGFEMPIYNTTKYYTVDADEVIQEAQTQAFEDVSKIVDNSTAEAWGTKVAEIIAEKELTDLLKNSAYSQFTFWVERSVAPEYAMSVKKGFRHGTPLLHRDLVFV